jgi:hypothetical protein
MGRMKEIGMEAQQRAEITESVVSTDVVGEQREKFPNHKPWVMAFGPDGGRIRQSTVECDDPRPSRRLVEVVSYPFPASYDLENGEPLSVREWRILVRERPGDPSSMVEHPAGQVEPLVFDGETVAAEEFCERNGIPY